MHFQTPAFLPRTAWFMRCVLLALALAGLPGRAALVSSYFTSGFANGGIVPDNDPSGWQNSQTVSWGANQQIQALTVVLNLQGGWNGDLQITLRHETPDGTGFAVLMDRTGKTALSIFGYGDTGFGPAGNGTPFRLNDAAAFNIQTYQDHNPAYNAAGQLTGTWRTSSRKLSTFNNLDPTGIWTLFVADLSGGDVSKMVSWGVEAQIQAVPEPVYVALVLFGGIFCLTAARRYFSQRLSRRLPLAGSAP